MMSQTQWQNIPELQTIYFTGNGCAITGLIDPSLKETALNGATIIRRQMMLLPYREMNSVQKL